MEKKYDNFIKLAIKKFSKNMDAFSILKKELSGSLKLKMPTHADLRGHYEEMIKKRKIKRNLQFEKALLSRKIRTQSGVAIVAVLTKAYRCPGKCIYCPSEKNMPKSYLSDEPAVMRAINSKFDPYHQVQSRLQALLLNGHDTDKIELIVMGGTFSCLSKTYQKKFIAECFRACNDFPRFSPFRKGGSKGDLKNKSNLTNPSQPPFSKGRSLLSEQKRNEKAKHRIIGLTLETRPDFIDEKEILNFRNLGCTRVELGVQSVFDDVLKKNKRGHNVQRTIGATKLLKDAGFKINYHIMPGLHGSNLKRDYLMFETLFKSSDFQPDMLKIYPTVVIKNSALYGLWKSGKYKALTDENFEKFILKVKNKIIPPYVRIARLVRDVPTGRIEAGPRISNLRQIVAKNSTCQCIRCREVRGEYIIKDLPAMFRSNIKKDDLKNLLKQKKKVLSESDIAIQAGKIILDRINYNASDGKEIFLQYVSPDKKKLFALLRLRIIDKKNATIRELHTYGKLAKINQQDKKSPQHIGLGKKLILEAEKIAKKEFSCSKIAVISGIGVRNYYRKLGYRLNNTYMIKYL